jgi:hypothetical protein
LVNIPINEQDVINTLDAMPRTPQQAGVVNVQLKRKKSMTTSHCQQFQDDPNGHEFLFGEGENVDPISQFINQDVLDAFDGEFVIGSNFNEGEGEPVGESVDDQFRNLDPVRRQQFQN